MLVEMPGAIEITELVLRDAHQGLMATRMATEDMIPACEDLDNAGFWRLNVGAAPPTMRAFAS